MGLDMYLIARTRIKEEEHIKEMNLPKYDNATVIIESEAAYWRKANAIHKWFVDNVQGGSDDCEEYRVEIEKLQELVDICKKVIEYKDKEHFDLNAKILLPTQSGFFFGSTDYDEWYTKNLEDTVDMLEKAIEEDDKLSDEQTSYYYVSSW